MADVVDCPASLKSARYDIRLGAKLLVKDLDRDFLADLRMDAKVDKAHPSFADLGLNVVVT